MTLEESVQALDLDNRFMFGKHTLKNCVHLNQSMITVYVFGDTNVIVCYIYLITYHLKYDMIMCYVWLIASHLKCDVIRFGCDSCIQLAKLVLFYSILNEM